MNFVGRERELELLNGLRSKRSASLVVIRGRRRIGKSRLAEEFGRSFRRCLVFTGLAPDPGVDAVAQREYFAAQLARVLSIPLPRADDWDNLFWTLAQHVQKSATLVVLDEITWMGDADSTFLAKLKSSWDLHLKKNARLILILSGSVSTWIARNILSSTGFLGRISLEITLGELPLPACSRFWQGTSVSALEKFKVLSVTGGVPRYLEEIQVHQTAEQNITRLCFAKDGLLTTEFERIFADLFGKRTPVYKRLVKALSKGPAEAQDLVAATGISKGGDLYEYLEVLVSSGFVSRDYTWRLRDGTPSKLSHYRLSDNYLRFYLRYIERIRHRIRHGVGQLPRNWESILGLQFENLLLNSRSEIWQRLGVEGSDIVADNPYFQRPTTKTPGCQIDYLIQDRFGTLWVCEAKFSKSPLGAAVVKEMRNKLARLKRPRNFSVRPVLIYAGDIKDAIEDSGLFARVIDATTLLDPPKGDA